MAAGNPEFDIRALWQSPDLSGWRYNRVSPRYYGIYSGQIPDRGLWPEKMEERQRRAPMPVKCCRALRPFAVLS